MRCVREDDGDGGDDDGDRAGYYDFSNSCVKRDHERAG